MSITEELRRLWAPHRFTATGACFNVSNRKLTIPCKHELFSVFRGIIISKDHAGRSKGTAGGHSLWEHNVPIIAYDYELYCTKRTCYSSHAFRRSLELCFTV